MLIPLLRILRPSHALLLTFPYLVTLYYLRGGLPFERLPGDLVSAAGLMLVLAGGYGLNDAADVRYDRCRPRPGPVASGAVRVRTAAALGLLLMLGGIAVSAAAASAAFALTLVAVAAGLVLYDFTSKRIGLWKDLVVGLLMSSTYLLAAAQSPGLGSRAAVVPFFALWMLLTTIAYEICSDIRDRHSDRAAGGGPRPIQRHPRQWLRIADVLVLLAAILLLAPAFRGSGHLYAILLPLTVGLPLWQCLRARRPEPKMAWVYAIFAGVGTAAIAGTLAHP